MAETLIAWDTCVIIDAIQRSESRYGALIPMVNKAVQGDLEIAVSTLSIAETLYLKDLASDGATQERQNTLIERWFDEPYVLKRNADFSVCSDAAELARRHGILKPADAVIVATAIRNGADALITYDGESARGKGLLQLDGALGNPGLRISTPENWSVQREIEG
ncbi:MAG: type II toxin-antitoxin system VapC family toxin [Salinisphaeraceae bacterium]